MKETLNERRMIVLVQTGVWEVDAVGRIWWATTRAGNLTKRRRAEKQLPNGYLMTRAMFERTRLVVQAHRLVWQHFVGDIPEGMVINHKNGLKNDNRPANLEVVSCSENTKHAYRVGLKDQHGERNPFAKLSDHDVGAIRAAYAAGGVTMAELGRRFGCAFQHISRIVHGQRRPKQAGPVSDSDLRQFPEVRA